MRRMLLLDGPQLRSRREEKVGKNLDSSGEERDMARANTAAIDQTNTSPARQCYWLNRSSNADETPRLKSYDLVVLAHQPNTIRQYKAYSRLIKGLHWVAPFLMRDPIPEPLGGHYGVTRSLCMGLRAVGVRFAYAPRLERTIARAAVVLAGIAELRAAMDWRPRGGCDLLLAGPNVVELPDDGEGILLSPEVDRVIVASDKVRLQYETVAPQLAGRISVWPAGVDENTGYLAFRVRVTPCLFTISACLSWPAGSCETCGDAACAAG